MLHVLALHQLFGKPLIMFGGLAVFLLVICTATIGALNFKGIRTIPFKWHPRLAALTILAALFHGLLGLSIIYNF